MLMDTPVGDPVSVSAAELFRPGAYQGPPRTGIELEMIPTGMSTNRPVPPRPSRRRGLGTLPVLVGLAAAEGWAGEEGSGGLPSFVLPGGGRISYEPGGQIEYASPALAHLPSLRSHLIRIMGLVDEAMAREGIRLLARGVDPVNPISEARLHLEGERYPRQRAHYDRRGRLGRVMMLQSAAVHLNLDLGDQPFESWRAANRLSPLLVALFANSARRCGASGAHRSQRAALWRGLDPSRNGVFDSESDGGPSADGGEGAALVAEYERFALNAESFLLGAPDEPPRAFAEWLERGAGLDDWRRHLTTLFPEVRPRGYLEIRSLDALPARLAIVAAAVTVALVHGPRARAEFLRRFPPADAERLERAGRLGVTDPALRQEAMDLHGLVQSGLEELGDEISDPTLREAVSDYFLRFPAEGLDPGALSESWIVS